MKIDKKYLPSKNFSIIIILIICFSTFIAIYFYKKENLSVYKNAFILNDAFTSKWTKTKIDTDFDGLEDWKEILYGTNINSKDTDSDGTDDNTEIEKGRDPLKENTSDTNQTPNDLMDKIIIEKYQSYIRENLYTPYTSIIKNKINSEISNEITSNSNITEIVAKKVIENIPKIEYSGKIKASDLTVVEPSEESIKDYLRFYALETKNIILFLEKDINIITTSNIESVEYNKLLDLLSFTKENFIKAHLPGNSDWGLSYHLGIINKLEEMYLEIEDLKKTYNEKDDIMYYASLESYYKSRSELISTLEILDNIFGLTR